MDRGFVQQLSGDERLCLLSSIDFFKHHNIICISPCTSHLTFDFWVFCAKNLHPSYPAFLRISSSILNLPEFGIIIFEIRAERSLRLHNFRTQFLWIRQEMSLKHHMFLTNILWISSESSLQCLRKCHTDVVPLNQQRSSLEARHKFHTHFLLIDRGSSLEPLSKLHM